ncbi:hypothetical protein SLEP1_g32816 [Rubroshorea leprosula]|uniref:Uncharacterized protein n=1 Tax=Rubroshorea leprosula TaxID=152421 RepID=A0AAV5KEQ6_9ROSI|nr:hypothetical protein SLEP1_g32816 [Rubroshorea leprosula]
MEMDYVTEFPHSHMDRRPRKRARLGCEFNQAQEKLHWNEYVNYCCLLHPVDMDKNLFILSA